MTQTAPAAASFSFGIKSLHWAVGTLVLIMLYSGFTLSRETATWHFGFGIVVLVLMVFWLAFKGRAARPAYPDMPRWQRIAAKATHHSLFALVTLQPLFGLLLVTTTKGNPYAFGIIPLKIAQNDTLHEVGEVLHMTNAFIITALVTLHVLGALYHHIIVRDNVLKRMLPFGQA